MFFVAKILLTQPLKSKKIWLPNLKYQLKNKYPPLAKNFTKRYHSVVTHVPCHFCMWHEFDNGLWNFLHSKVPCCLHMYFLWRHHLSPNKSKKIATLIDSHIVLTYDCWHYFLVSNISVSHAFEMIITQPLSCFVFHLPNLLLTQNFVYPTLFSSLPPPAINNDRSLNTNLS
jgi:hypothetical protein